MFLREGNSNVNQDEILFMFILRASFAVITNMWDCRVCDSVNYMSSTRCMMFHYEVLLHHYEIWLYHYEIEINHYVYEPNHYEIQHNHYDLDPNHYLFHICGYIHLKPIEGSSFFWNHKEKWITAL